MVITSAPASAMGPAATRGSSQQQPKHEGQGCAHHRGTRDASADAAQQAQGDPRPLFEPDQPDQPDRGPGRQPEHQSRGRFVLQAFPGSSSTTAAVRPLPVEPGSPTGC